MKPCQFEKIKKVLPNFRMEADEMNEEKTMESKLYTCDLCKESFTTRIILMMHKDVKHSQQLPDIGLLLFHLLVHNR